MISATWMAFVTYCIAILRTLVCDSGSAKVAGVGFLGVFRGDIFEILCFGLGGDEVSLSTSLFGHRIRVAKWVVGFQADSNGIVTTPVLNRATTPCCWYLIESTVELRGGGASSSPVRS